MSKDLPPSRTAEQFVVRLPEGMRDQIAEAAKATGRSMNAEIVQRLQESFRTKGSPEQLEGAWETIRAQNARRDNLMAKLASVQAKMAQVTYLLTSAVVDDLSVEEVHNLKAERRDVDMESFRIRKELDHVVQELDAAYALVEGHTPQREVKISRLEG